MRNRPTHRLGIKKQVKRKKPKNSLCKVCGKKLSMYNHTGKCYSHTYDEVFEIFDRRYAGLGLNVDIHEISEVE